MTESQFLLVVEDTLTRIEESIEAAALPADCSLSGHVLSIELDDGSRIIVNAQTPTRQLWLAARSGGMHFVHDGHAWHDLRSGEEFFACLSRALSEQAGTQVRLRAAD